MAVPTGNAGAMANAKSQLRMAYDIFVKALPSFPMGSEDHTKLLSIMQTLNKLAPASAEVPGVQATTAASLNQGAQKSAMMDMLKSLAPAGASAGGGGAPGPPAAPPTPAMTPPLAA